LDIIPDFIEKGQSLLGSRLLAKKCPKLLVIDESSISTGERFMADAVVSSDVAFHIHPDEAPGYFAILSRLTGKKGARLVFDAKTSERPYRYNESGWAWPVDHYVQFLRPLELVSIHHQQTYYYDAACSTGYFEFRRV